MIDNNLLGQIQPQIQLILWPNQDSLTLQTPYFFTLNYLFEGIIKKTISEFKDPIYSHLFFTKQFSKPLWLLYFTKIDQLPNYLESVLIQQKENDLIFSLSPQLGTVNISELLPSELKSKLVFLKK